MVMAIGFVQTYFFLNPENIVNSTECATSTSSEYSMPLSAFRFWHAPARLRWTDLYKHVIGVVHTNYQAVVSVVKYLTSL